MRTLRVRRFSGGAFAAGRALLQATLFERLGSLLRKDQRVVPEEVVHVDAFRRQELMLLAVADRELQLLVLADVDDERLLLRLERLERFDELLRLDLFELDAVDDEEAPFLAELRERAGQRERAHAARGLVRPVAGARRVRLAAADEQRRADRTVTRAARALLLVELLRAAADRGAVLGALVAGSLGRELGFHHFVEEVLADFRPEDLVGEIDRTDLLALHVEDVERCH